eukprot:CAMPEP_0119064680 /NCGR_PEP_ID=MMETSP1178-20130426/7699_1 /TAXON_ID=33656 /ORGANISM="unid sp, Strain CCMP2000" /LENGTH=72 /DNA_ID=CAMNT_0007046137 /DNA_START=239 /DNA_END=455 /DNA_ORIENTATION=-
MSDICGDAVCDAGGRVPAEHGVQAAKAHGKLHLRELAALRLVTAQGAQQHLQKQPGSSYVGIGAAFVLCEGL